MLPTSRNVLRARRRAGAALVVVAACFGPGCTLGPSPDRPELPFEVEGEYAADPATRPADRLEDVTGWWRRFGDDVTDDLVTAAVAGNQDLRAAAARVLQARALRDQASGARLPSLSLGFDASGRKISPAGTQAVFPIPEDAIGGGDISFDDFIETYDLTATVSWQTDLFGRLRRTEQAASYELLSTQADRLALTHTIVAQTILSRVAIATLSERLRLAQDNLASLQETLDVVEGRYRAGVGDPVELRLARENVASAEAQIPPVQTQLALERHALAVLLGRRMSNLEELPNALSPLPDLPPPPVGLPAALLDRRPDLLASQFRAMAAQARIGAAIADLFPNLTLTGSYGFTSNELGKLFNGDSEVYSIIGGLTQPIFQGGQLRAGIRRARAVAEEQAANYAGNVLNAFREVNDALVQEANGRAEVEASERALSEAVAAEELARDRFGRGVGNLLSVFESERRRRAAEERLTLARQGVWNARVNLHLALGGDWGFAPDATN